MKKTHIIAGILVVLAVAIFVQVSGEVSPYVNFSTASSGKGKVKIVGQLVKTKPMVYDAEKDPNYFSFYLQDQEGVTHRVVLLQGKPQDFELSEQIVLTGRMQEDHFLASEVQLKCPSKYKDEESFLKELGEG
ncbi:MAG: cytochrome c maturation protein CcmE [Bacteroidota bacterium]